MRGILTAFLILMRYEWPGNVCELKGVIEHAVLFATGDYLMPEDLPDQRELVDCSFQGPQLARPYKKSNFPGQIASSRLFDNIS